jgi:O-antigen/teichoic acid export membrane protein
MAATPDIREPDGESDAPAIGGAQARVVRNTAFLMAAQVLGMPLSMTVNAIMARKLGPEDFGYIYLAGTLVAFGFLAVEWGQNGTLPSMIARDRTLLRGLVGSAIAWRLASAVVVYAAIAVVSALLGYGKAFQSVLLLVVLARVAGTVCAALLDSARGLEVTSTTAVSGLRYNILCAVLVIPTVLLGGGLRGVLLALFLADIINTAFVWRAARALGMKRLSVEAKTVRVLVASGTSFMFLGLALVLQPNVDAILLSKLGTPEAMGWHAAARKLVGVLVFPVTALSGALYPTLCRLFAEDRPGYQRLVSSTLRTATILVVPMALGAALYPQLGIRIFSEASFGPAEDNLRVLSVFILLLYFTMVLGPAITAAGRQRAWSMMQLACVVVSAVADPLLIPWFQERFGNGSLGVCVSTVLSEALMIVGGFLIAPRGLFDRPLLKGIALSLAAGGVMAIVSRQLSPWLSPFIGAPLSVAAYVTCLWLTGGIDRGTVQSIRGMVARRMGRTAGA